MSFTITNWTCLSSSLNQGQQTVIPFGGSTTIINAPNIFIYGNPNDSISEITSAGYFNPVLAELSKGDWIIGNGSDGSFLLYISNITNGVVTVAFVSSGGGDLYLLKSANLSDVADPDTALKNLGTGTGESANVDDSDFNSSEYQIPIPFPAVVFITATSPGLTVRLPVANIPGSSPSPGQGVIIRSVASTQSFDVAPSTGSSLITLDNLESYSFDLEDNSTAAGTWRVTPQVLLINNKSGSIDIISSDDTIDIDNSVPNLIDLSASGLAPADKINQVIFFDTVTGNDLTGDGKPGNPFATYSAASLLAQSSASAANQYLIKGYGTSTELGMLIYPFVHVDLSECVMNVTNNVALSSQFNSKSNSYARVVASELNAGAGVFTFTTYQNAKLEFFVNWGTTPTVTFTGSKTTQPEIIIMNGRPNYTGAPNIIFDSVFSIIEGVGGLGNISYDNSSNSYSCQSLLKDQGSLGAISVSSTGSGGMELIISGCPDWTFLNIIGSAPLIDIDSPSYSNSPVLSSGATISQLRPLTSSDGVNVNYTPSNYIPVGTSTVNDYVVTAHLKGIDDALGNGVDNITLGTATGATSVTLVSSLASKNGNIATLSGSITFTATLTNVTIILEPPFGTLFNAPGQASGVGIVNKISGPAIGDGTVAIVDSVSGQGIELNMILATGSGNYRLDFSVQCSISN